MMRASACFLWRKGLIAATILISLVAAACTSTGDAGNSGAAGASLAHTGVRAGETDGDLRVVEVLPPPLNTHDGADQPLAASDVLEVDVFQVDDLDRTVQVDSSGQISLPLIGSVQAAGKTVRALEQEIESAYGGNYLQSPEVTVFVKESFGQRVTVDGEVAKAGIYPVTGRSTLLEIIAVAGGVREIADPTKIYVFRDHGGQRLVANFNVEQIRSGKSSDPRIYGGDVVVVFTSQSRVAMRNLREALGLASSAAGLAVIP